MLANVAVSETTGVSAGGSSAGGSSAGGSSAGGSSAGGSSCAPEDDSPFSMTPVPVASSRVAWVGLESVRVSVSESSSSESARTVTWTVWDVSPALKVRVAAGCGVVRAGLGGAVGGGVVHGDDPA